jgi:Restriction endonuclease BamHI
MKIVRIETPIAAGAFARSRQWSKLRSDLHREIVAVDWPPGTGKFIIYPESGKGRRKGNGVKPIKAGLIQRLKAKGWKPEEPLGVAVATKPGKVDAVRYTPNGRIALEWETGNISSSHRALNKMALGLLKGVLAAGVLVVPSRKLYKFLTDRVGNFDELEPYLDLWKSIPCSQGVLEIVVIEQDGESTSVPRIRKGTDGRALA